MIMSEYENLLCNLMNLQDDEKIIRVLSVITELILQVKDKHLKGAEYTNEFNYGRLKLKLFIGQE